MRQILRRVFGAIVQIAVVLSAMMLPEMQNTPHALAASCTLDPSNLTTNGSMAGPGVATPYGSVANGWTPFVLSQVVPAFELVFNENANGDVAGTGSEYIWADTDAFDAGIYQTVDGLTPGVYYRFWLGSALAAFDLNGGGNTRNNLIGRQVGIDLTGDTNPSSSSVRWGNVYWDGTASLNIPDLSLTIAAQSTSATIFVRVVNANINNGRSKVWFDVVCMEALSPQPPPKGPSTLYLPLVNTQATLACNPLSALTTVDVGSHPKGLAADSATNRVFVSLFDDSTVAVMDAASNHKVAEWPTNNDGHSNGIAATGGRVFVSLRDTGRVTVLDATTGQFVAGRSVGSEPYGVGGGNGKVWVANFASNSVTLLDASSANVITTTNSGGSPALVVPAASGAYISYFDGGVMEAAVDGTTLNNFAVGAGSYGVAFDAASNRIYVSNRNTSQLTALDSSTGIVVKTVTLAQVPYALALNPVSHHLFVVLAGSNLLDVRDGTTLTSLGVLPIGVQGVDGGDGIAVLNGRVYVANHAAGTVSVIQDNCGT